MGDGIWDVYFSDVRLVQMDERILKVRECARERKEERKAVNQGSGLTCQRCLRPFTGSRSPEDELLECLRPLDAAAAI